MLLWWSCMPTAVDSCRFIVLVWDWRAFSCGAGAESDKTTAGPGARSQICNVLAMLAVMHC